MDKETIDKIRYDAEMAEIEYRGDDKYPSSQLAYEKLVRDYEFDTVLDIGCGTGYISDFFSKHGKIVTACDYRQSFRFKENKANDVVVGDYNTIEFANQFDCIWCSHVLEHQLNVQGFLEKINRDLKDGGVLAITVPPLKDRIVGGHVSLWNAGLLLYRLVLAGFDCSEASVRSYGYNVSVIIVKKAIDIHRQLVFDAGDIDTIKPYLPNQIDFIPHVLDLSYDGRIDSINW